jgi:hypothetical protein
MKNNRHNSQWVNVFAWKEDIFERSSAGGAQFEIMGLAGGGGGGDINRVSQYNMHVEHNTISWSNFT